MKRLLICLLLTALCGLLSAQEGNRRPQKAEPEKTALITVNGNLGVSGGMIALESGDTVYYVPGLQRFVGFIEGLKEGAPVTLEGYEIPAPFFGEGAGKVFRVTRMTLNGKEYDVGFKAPFGNRDSRPSVSPPGFNRMRNFRFDQSPDPRGGGSRYPRHRE
ncbi:MAG: hypothetical protein LBC62_10415 [Treponema sp.]|nr:hypothetical protein [Treponema sp.]